MATRKRPHSLTPPPDRGNFVSEWFGHRVYPAVVGTEESFRDQLTENCPFLSKVEVERTECVKKETNKGICTISSSSNGRRQEWLVCPYRALDLNLFSTAAHRLFDVKAADKTLLVSGSSLTKPEIRKKLADHVKEGKPGIVYLTKSLGGEVKLSATEKSPAFSFDSTLVEIVSKEGHYYVGRYAIFELQTMDFHGSYEHALRKLKGALRLDQREFPKLIENHKEWLSEKIEGPNTANVFKRTFYQMMFKFQIAAHDLCAGCVFAIPEAVWDSWQKHLGRPELAPMGEGLYELASPGREGEVGRASTWIIIFDIDVNNPASPQPLIIKKTIATDADSLSYFALKVAPEYAIASGGSADRLLLNIHSRLVRWWPELEMP